MLGKLRGGRRRGGGTAARRSGCKPHWSGSIPARLYSVILSYRVPFARIGNW